MKKAQQTDFWKGEFGDSYVERNVVAADDRVPFFSRILQRTYGVASVCELGANKGHNLQAVGSLSPNFELVGVDVNRRAVEIMAADSRIKSHCSPIQEFDPRRTFDLVFICAVLIHIGPQDLPAVYRKLYDLSSRYVLINEYFNPTPMELNYRGHTEKLFKRDFGGEFWDLFPKQVRLVDYGFVWKRIEPAWDDTTWWLFEKIPPFSAGK